MDTLPELQLALDIETLKKVDALDNIAISTDFFRKVVEQAKQAVLFQRRLDWLARQYVVVHTPLRWGSRECFNACPDLEDTHSDLIEKIDVALIKEKVK